MTIETLAPAVLAGLLLAGPLTPGLPVQRELAAGEAQAWRVELPAGRPFRVAVEQRGIDVTVEAAGPDGQKLVAVDSPQDREGTESLLLAPAAAGAYAITVQAREPGAPPSGRYEIRLDAVADSPAGAASRAAEAALTRAGELYLQGSAEAHRQSLPLYATARERFRAAGDRRGEARALYEQAVVSRLVDETRAALALAQEVLPLWQALGDRLFAAASENEIGLDRWLLREADGGVEARAAFGRALALSRGAADRYGEAVAQSNLCLMDLAHGDLRQGVACYGRALPRLAEVKAAALLGGALTSVGRAYDALGEPQEARDRYEQALTHLRAIGNRDGEARTLNSLGVLDVGLGEIEAALARYGEALARFQALGDRRGQARVQNNLGLVYHTVDEPRRAKASYEAALALWRAVGDRAGEAASLTNLGLVEARLGQPREALACHRQALEIERAIGDRRGEAIALTQLGRTELALGEPAAALPAFDQAAERLAAAGDRRNQAEALCGQGEARGALGDGPGALASLGQALAMARQAVDHPAEAHALLALARAERRLGQTGEARRHAAAALDAIESLRTGIGGPDLRAAFSALVHQAYELDVDLLMEAHRAAPSAGLDREALAVGERARARTLLDFLGTTGIGIHAGVDPALLARRTALAARLSAKAERAARERPATPETTGTGSPAEGEGEPQEILRELDLVEAEIRARSPGYAELTRPQPLDTAGIQALLDADTLLLAYSLGEERSYLWAVTPEAMASFELPPKATIETLARQLHRQWSTADPETRRAAAETAAALSRLLLGPLAGQLDRRRLAVVADGALHYIPFAALPLAPSGEPLLARHEVVVLPSASALAVARRVLAARPPAPKWLAVLADPVFDRADPRVPRIAASSPASPAPADPLPPPADLPPFARLPASRQEAEAIAALAPPGEALVALDFAADRQAVQGDRLAAYRVVHFATHGIVDTDRPALSGLALSSIDRDGRPQAGFLPLRDIYNLHLQADLVVLSGCRTALGRELSGEGLVGLTRGFQYAGAARVVASLWPVEDRATERLMTRFYRALWSEKLPPAAALREAQLALRAERPYRDPFFWAGFVLAGDWR